MDKIKKCPRCNRLLDRSNFYIIKRKYKEKIYLSTGHLCKSCDGKRVNATHDKPARRYLMLKRSAKARNYTMELSMEDMMLFWQKACYYCGDGIKTVGLDRVDNKKGYTIENIVSCCENCNRMKLTQTKEEFLEKVRKIYDIHCF